MVRQDAAPWTIGDYIVDEAGSRRGAWLAWGTSSNMRICRGEWYSFW